MPTPPHPGFELRQLRTFVAVAERLSFTLAADDLHIAQQAVSQQIRSLEQAVGVTLLDRSPRSVSLTSAGAVFLADARRVLSAANRASERVRAAALGEAGGLRLAYTLTAVWETIPSLLARIGELYPKLKVDAREVFGGDVEELLDAGRFDLAVAPMTAYSTELKQQRIRSERLRIALSDDDAFGDCDAVELSRLSDRQFEVWPRNMAPGFYDAVLSACRAVGFEPQLDERAGGNTVWGYIAEGRGVGLINESLAAQLPRGLVLVDIADAQPQLVTELVWHRHTSPPLVESTVRAAAELAKEKAWVST